MQGILRLICLTLLYFQMGTMVSAEKRLAFVVGNSAYENVGSLDNPINDALDISVALEGLGFDVILGSDVDRVQMHEAIARFAGAAKFADVVMFYYAGHGFQVSGENFLVPVDADLNSINDLRTQTIPLTDILGAMENSPGLKLVVLDACRDNPFDVGLETMPGAGNGLARVGTSANFMFVYATQPDNVAYDGTGRNSFFTEAMLDHIYTPGQDISELMISVRRDVLAATGGRQVPWENSSVTRSFRFDNSPETVSEETLLWQVAARERDSNLLQLYVDRYPQGAHVADVTAFLDTDANTRSLGGRAEEKEPEAERLWTLARRSRMRPLLEFYLERYPSGANLQDVERLLALIPRAEDATPAGVCERLATHPRDATASTSGSSFDRLRQNALTAIQACAAAAAQSPDLPHLTALLARATAASGDLERAVQLYTIASDRGDLRAMVSLAQLTERGNGVPQDLNAALMLYERAAKAGSADAMINLAITLFEGTQVPQNASRAIILLRRAADGGSAKALFNLGVLAQDNAVGEPADALGYFQRAAKDGEIQGYQAAAILLDEGRGVPRDPIKAANMLLRGVAEDSGGLLEQLTKSTKDWSHDTIVEVQKCLKAAGYYVSAIDGLPGPNFTGSLTRWRNGGFKAEVLVN